MNVLIGPSQMRACVMWAGVAASQKPADDLLPAEVRSALADNGRFELAPGVNLGPVYGLDGEVIGFGVEVHRFNEPPDAEAHEQAKERAYGAQTLVWQAFQRWGIEDIPPVVVYEDARLKPEVEVE